MGFTDDPKHGMVKLFCPKCQDVYSCVPNQRRKYIYMFIYTCTYTYIHIYIHKYIPIHIYIYMRFYCSVLNVKMFTVVYQIKDVSTLKYTSIHIHVHIYVCIYIYIHPYIYIYIYIYMWSRCLQLYQIKA
jgi:hypothetical protein